jgi:hypothetical protein
VVVVVVVVVVLLLRLCTYRGLMEAQWDFRASDLQSIASKAYALQQSQIFVTLH